jgi:hypothetical protein
MFGGGPVHLYAPKWVPRPCPHVIQPTHFLKAKVHGLHEENSEFNLLHRK